MLLVAAGALALERAAVLPKPAATAVRQVEAWLAPLLEGIGIDLPPPQDQDAGVPPEVADDRAAVAQALALLKRVPIKPDRWRGYDQET